MSALSEIFYCWRHGVWYGDKGRPTCPECDRG